MHAFTGPACAVVNDSTDGRVSVFLTGRDELNRSQMGRGTIDFADSPLTLVAEADPCIELGELGSFDENGVSYPCVFGGTGAQLMYYVGWMPTVLTPFQTHIGLARETDDGSFERVSRAPILARTDADRLAMGSCFVLAGGESEPWRMWYTSFTGWGVDPSEPKHSYVIKYATSADGVSWDRDDTVCISPVHPGEHSISRPSVLRRDGAWHMWFCWRGDDYSIGYATSVDGKVWDRMDDRLDLGVDGEWDSMGQSYPHVFEHKGELWMLYCGNGYGRDGLGLAKFIEG